MHAFLSLTNSWLLTYSETVLTRMRAAPFWRRGEAGVLSRLLTDLVLFDLLESHQEMLAARTLSVRGGEGPCRSPFSSHYGYDSDPWTSDTEITLSAFLSL